MDRLSSNEVKGPLLEPARVSVKQTKNVRTGEHHCLIVFGFTPEKEVSFILSADGADSAADMLKKCAHYVRNGIEEVH